MDDANLISLAPIIVLALTGVVAMVLAPLVSAERVRAVTAAGLVVALVLILARLSAAPAPATVLLADDGLARLTSLIATLAGLGALALSRAAPQAREGPALIALTCAGAAALGAAKHAATLFLGLEIMTVALVVLFAFPRKREALEAAYKFFLMGASAAAALLLGLAVGLGETGRLDLSVLTAPAGDPILALVGALILAGLAFKFALVPFHMWAPDAFDGAPASSLALAGIASKVAVAAVLIRLAGIDTVGPVWTLGLAVTGSASVLGGNLLALRQESLGRMLGYSSIAHSGYLALVLASGAGLTAETVMVYLAAYTPALLAALAIPAIMGRGSGREELRGLIWQRPLLGLAFALAMLALAGLPPAVGFVGKVYLFTALAQAEAWILLAIAAAGSAIAFFYYVRFATRVFVKPAETGDPPAPPGDATRVLLIVCVLLIVALGIYPEPLIGLVRSSLA